MWNGLSPLQARPLRAVALVASLAALGCRAQTAPPAAHVEPVQVGVQLSAGMTRRIEVMIRSKSNLSEDYAFTVGTPEKSAFNGYDRIEVSFAADGKPAGSASFLLSDDGKTLAQLSQFDISQDPAAKVSANGRPSRGGPPDAPVTIVGFDDLECPFCAIMNDQLIPQVLKRYKGQVRMVYRDFPLEELHPWAKHAAIDANCLAAGSTDAYWSFVDYVHAHAADMAGTEKTNDKAGQNLDKIALDEGTKAKLNPPDLIACVLKQDARAVDQSILQGEADPLRLNQAPVLFINGEKIEGIVPIETLYRVIDRALVAAGQTPPPPVAPAAAAKPRS